MIGKKKFIASALDLEYKAFVVYITAVSLDLGDKVHPSKRAQIAYLKVNKALFEISSKYANFADIFLPKLAIELLENTRVYNHTIEQVDDRQPRYGLTYSLGPMQLEILKAYIKNNLANSFIVPSKFPAKASIFFDKKPDGNLR